MSFLDDCRRLIGLDSTPGHGNLAAAEYAGRLCEDSGLHVVYQRETVEGIEQCNVIARPAGEIPSEEFLFLTHLDTAEAGHFSHWTKTQSNPFNASIYNDVLYGLGAADVKLDFLCKLEALKPYAGRALRRPFVLVGTFGAQSGMNGAIKLIRRKKINVRRALIGQPTDLHPVIAGQGLAVVEISIPFSDEERAYRRDHDLTESSSSQSRMFSGRAASLQDPRGENAITKVLTYLSQLPEGIALMDFNGGVSHNSVPSSAVLEIDTVAGFREPIVRKISTIFSGVQALERDLQEFRELGFNPPYPTVNLGMVRTSESEVRFTGCCHLPPTVTDAVYEGWMKRLDDSVRSVGATFRVRDYRKGFTTPADGEFTRQIQGVLGEMGLPAQTQKITVATEASVLSRLGIECLVWGPGQSVGNSLAPNESIKIGDLQTAVEFYRRCVERFCL